MRNPIEAIKEIFFDILKIPFIFLKEINLVMAQKMSIALLVFLPIFAVISVAAAFGGDSAALDFLGDNSLDRVDVAIFLPESTSVFDSDDFWEKIHDNNRLNLTRVRSESELKNQIRLGKSKMGLEVVPPRNFSEDINVIVYVDNSRLLSAKAFVSYAYFGIDSVSYQTSTDILAGIWNDLNVIESNLVTETSRTDDFIKALEEADKQLTDLNDNIHQINIGQLEGHLDSFDSAYSETKTNLERALNDLNNIDENVDVYKTEIETEKANLETYKTSLEYVKEQVDLIGAVTPEPAKSSLVSVSNDLNAAITDVTDSINQLDSFLSDMDYLDDRVSENMQNLMEANSGLDEAKIIVEDFNKSLIFMDSTLEEMKALLSDASVSRKQTVKDLESTKELLIGLTQTLNKFRNYSPSYLVNPINVFEEKMYPVDDLSVVIPTSIAIVLLMMCILLSTISTLGERRQGVSLRVELASVSKFSWLSGKILGLMLFAIIESIIILLIAVFIFGVAVAGSLLELFIAILAISFAFISIGLFITNFTDNQSTAILASLLLMVPLLFMSGIIFPLEFMPLSVSWIAELLPLTAANNLLVSIIIRGSTLAESFFHFAIIFGLGIVLFAFTLLKKEI